MGISLVGQDSRPPAPLAPSGTTCNSRFEIFVVKIFSLKQ